MEDHLPLVTCICESLQEEAVASSVQQEVMNLICDLFPLALPPPVCEVYPPIQGEYIPLAVNQG